MTVVKKGGEKAGEMQYLRCTFILFALHLKITFNLIKNDDNKRKATED